MHLFWERARFPSVRDNRGKLWNLDLISDIFERGGVLTSSWLLIMFPSAALKERITN